MLIAPDHQRRSHGGAEGLAPEEIEHDEEQQRDPDRGRNICGSLQGGSKADVEGLKGQKTEDEHSHGKEDGAGASQVVVHHPSYVGTAVADGAAARHGLGDEGDGKHVDYAQ